MPSEFTQASKREDEQTDTRLLPGVWEHAWPLWSRGPALAIPAAPLRPRLPPSFPPRLFPPTAPRATCPRCGTPHATGRRVAPARRRPIEAGDGRAGGKKKREVGEKKGSDVNIAGEMQVHSARAVTQGKCNLSLAPDPPCSDPSLPCSSLHCPALPSFALSLMLYRDDTTSPRDCGAPGRRREEEGLAPRQLRG